MMEVRLSPETALPCNSPFVVFPCAESGTDMTQVFLAEIVFQTSFIVSEPQKSLPAPSINSQRQQLLPALKIPVPNCPAPLSAGSSPTTPTSDMSFCLNADFQRINLTLQRLRASGFYYEGLGWQQANDLLQNVSIGTFLVRDSADPRFLFSLSVKTERGPTSVRIHYVNDRFRLDSEDSLAKHMPLFDTVTDLVEYYVHLSQTTKGSCCVWLDTTGRRDLPIRLKRPLYKTAPSLQHLCRLSINQRLSNTTAADKLGLPYLLKAFLREYPHHQQ